MPAQFLADTNIIIGVLGEKLEKWRVETLGRMGVSAVTVMELYALAGMGRQEELSIDQAVAFLVVFPVTIEVAKRAGFISRTRQKTQKADLLIAATAIEFHLPLVTRNIRDFKGIPGITLLTI